METVCAIELRNITKRFGKVVANDGIDLKLHYGEILSLLGERFGLVAVINPFSAILTGFLGIPGVGLVLVIQNLL